MRIQSSPSLSALSTLATSFQVTANNIANVNTNEFKASAARFETGPMDQGVQISEIRKDGSPGAYVQALVFTEENGKAMQRPGWVESSNTDIAREFVNMISTERAFQANVASIRTADEMLGAILDTTA